MKLTSSQKILTGIALVLAVAVGIKWTGARFNFELPLPGTIEARQREVGELRYTCKKLEGERERIQSELARQNEDVGIASLSPEELHSLVENRSRQAGVVLQRVGVPRTKEQESGITSVEVDVSTRGSTADILRLITAIEQPVSPRLAWARATIQAHQTPGGETMLSGTVMALAKHNDDSNEDNSQ